MVPGHRIPSGAAVARRFTAAATGWCGVLIALAAPSAAAPPQLNWVYPAGASCGESVQLTAGGSFSNWPPEVWVDRPGLTIHAADEKGQLQVQVADDAAPGIYLLRLVDDEGASSPRPLLVSRSPSTLEQEPNDTADAAQALAPPTIVQGRLGKRGDVDGYAVELQAGQSAVFAVTANQRLGSPMDTVMQVCDPEGFVLAQVDDQCGLDPLIVFRAPRTARYLVRLFAFPATPNSTIGFAGGDDYIYCLTATCGALVSHSLPLAVGSSGDPVELRGWNLPKATTANLSPTAEPPKWLVAWSPECEGSCRLARRDYPSVREPDGVATEPLALPLAVSGEIARDGEVDAVPFAAAKGQKIRIRVESRRLGFALDPLLRVVAADGKLLNEVDDVSKQRDAELVFVAPQEGQYRAEVTDLHHRGGLRFAYCLHLEPVQPSFAIQVNGDSWVGEVGQALTLAVNVDRADGFAEPIEIAAEGLPEGVRSAPVTSAAEGPTAKKVDLTFTADAPIRGPFRIVGRAASRTEEAEFAVGDLFCRDFWLTLKAAPK